MVFLVATFALTWACFLGAARLARPATTPAGSTLATVVFLTGVFAPAIVAIAMTTATRGRDGLRTLLGAIVQPVAARWYVFAVTYMVVAKLTVALLYRLVAGAWPRFGETPWYEMAGALLISMWVQAGEEIGWRGYLLPRFAERMALPVASVLLGIIWATWHLPLFFIFPGIETYHQSFIVYLLQVIAISVAMAWLYWRTGGVLLPVMVMHAAVNNTKDIVPSVASGATSTFGLSTSVTAWLTAGVLWAAAVFFLMQMRGIRTLTGTARAAVGHR